MARPTAITRQLIVGLVLGIPFGCTAILDFPEEVTGYRWCLDAEPARGQRADNLALIPIQYAAPSNNWTRACKCYCAADHEIMLQGANGELAPGSEDALWYDLEVGQLRASAVTECNDRIAELAAEEGTTISFGAPGTVSCLDAATDEPAYFVEECTQFDDLCPPGAPGGFGTDGYIPGTGSGIGSGSEASTSADDRPATGVDTTADGTADGSGTGAGDGTSGSVLRGPEELRARSGER